LVRACLPVVALRRNLCVVDGLLDLGGAGGDPGMSGSESLQALLRGGGVSVHRLQECNSLQFLAAELLLLRKRKGARALTHHPGKPSKLLQKDSGSLVLPGMPELGNGLAVIEQCALEIAARLLEMGLESRDRRRGFVRCTNCWKAPLGHILLLVGVEGELTAICSP
jgi:hypothetical protein